MYVLAVIACGATVLRDASGLEIPIIDQNTGLWQIPECAFNNSCKYGLMNFYQIAELTSAWKPLIIIGMFGMTISSTMTNMDQGPQAFQSACKDSIFPYMKYFEKEHQKSPRRAYILFSFLTVALTLIGKIKILIKYNLIIEIHLLKLIHLFFNNFFLNKINFLKILI